MSGRLERYTLPWYGGKQHLARWIVRHLPSHTAYVEPFGGMLSVLLAKPRAVSAVEVVNDLDGDVVNWWRVVRDHTEELQRRLRWTPYARSEYKQARAREGGLDDIERARRFYVQVMQGFSAILADHAVWAYGVKWNKGCLKNYAKIATLELLANRLRFVQWECLPAMEIFERYDRSETLFYCDPPYVPDSRHGDGYKHEMSTDDHAEMLEKLLCVQGMIVLSGYHCELYDDVLRDWDYSEYKIVLKTGGRRTEVLWFNTSATERLRRSRQMGLFEMEGEQK